MIVHDLTGKVAVITGGGRGFGKAFGMALAERGARVVQLDLDEAAAKAAAAETAMAPRLSWSMSRTRRAFTPRWPTSPIVMAASIS